MRALVLLPLGLLAACAAGGHAASLAPGAQLDAVGGDHASNGASTEARTATAARGRLLIRDADLTYEVASADEEHAVRKRVADGTASLGGYVSSEQGRTMVLRVPAARVDAALSGLESFGKVTRRSVRVQEVTGQHMDLAIRIDNAKKLRTRLQALLQQARDVKDMLDIERELARVTQELEQQEGQMRLLQDRISLSTITIGFEDKVTPGPIGWVFWGLYHGVKWLFVWD